MLSAYEKRSRSARIRRLGLSSVQLFAELTGVQRFQLGIRFGEPDEVEFVLFAFAPPPVGIAVSPEFALRHVLPASYLHTDPKDGSIY
jgi:hypothetical protein